MENGQFSIRYFENSGSTADHRRTPRISYRDEELVALVGAAQDRARRRPMNAEIPPRPISSGREKQDRRKPPVLRRFGRAGNRPPSKRWCRILDKNETGASGLPGRSACIPC